MWVKICNEWKNDLLNLCFWCEEVPSWDLFIALSNCFLTWRGRYFLFYILDLCSNFCSVEQFLRILVATPKGITLVQCVGWALLRRRYIWFVIYVTCVVPRNSIFYLNGTWQHLTSVTNLFQFCRHKRNFLLKFNRIPKDQS